MTDPLHIQVRYFASIREALGEGEHVGVDRAATVGALRDLLVARGGVHAEVLGRHRAVRAALDRTLCHDAAALHDGAEIGFFPPVTGG